MLDVSNKKLSENKPFPYRLKINCPDLVHFYDYKNVKSKYGRLPQLCLDHKSKVISCRTSLVLRRARLLCFCFSKNTTTRETCFLRSFTLPRQVIFSKSEEMLQDLDLQYKSKTWFFHKRTLKWFSFLPFETPSPLFLPKTGTVLLYSSSFSMVRRTII